MKKKKKKKTALLWNRNANLQVFASFCHRSLESHANVCYPSANYPRNGEIDSRRQVSKCQRDFFSTSPPLVEMRSSLSCPARFIFTPDWMEVARQKRCASMWAGDIKRPLANQVNGARGLSPLPRAGLICSTWRGIVREERRRGASLSRRDVVAIDAGERERSGVYG